MFSVYVNIGVGTNGSNVGSNVGSIVGCSCGVGSVVGSVVGVSDESDESVESRNHIHN